MPRLVFRKRGIRIIRGSANPFRATKVRPRSVLRSQKVLFRHKVKG